MAGMPPDSDTPSADVLKTVQFPAGRELPPPVTVMRAGIEVSATVPEATVRETVRSAAGGAVTGWAKIAAMASVVGSIVPDDAVSSDAVSDEAGPEALLSDADEETRAPLPDAGERVAVR